MATAFLLAGEAYASDDSWIEEWLSSGFPLLNNPQTSSSQDEEPSRDDPMLPRIVTAGYRAEKNRSARPASAESGAVAQRNKALKSNLAAPGAGLEAALPRVAGNWFIQAYPMLSLATESSKGNFVAAASPGGTPIMLDRERLQTLLMPGESLKSVGNLPTNAKPGFSHVRLEVSLSRHWLRLLGTSFFSKDEVLYECKTGLGARDFPTPVGIYFVTHIYDESPLWIPPPNRAWAAGQSPSRRVYGGTMAPLLKKNPVASRKGRAAKSKSAAVEDWVEREVKLDDYGYRFHGTNQPRSIGRNESHGCVRLLPADANRVASLIKQYVGTSERKESDNGTYVILKAPVRLDMIK